MMKMQIFTEVITVLQLMISLVLSTDLDRDNSTRKEDYFRRLASFKPNPSQTGHFFSYKETKSATSAVWNTPLIVGKEAAKISDHLRELANNELGVTVIQSLFDSLTYETKDTNHQDEVNKIAASIEARLTGSQKALLTNRAQVQNLYQFHKRKPISQAASCCPPGDTSSSSDTSRSSYSDTLPTQHSVCDLLPTDLKPNSFNPGRNLTAFSQNWSKYPMLKSQYFISSDGTHNEYPSLPVPAADTESTCSHLQCYRHSDIYTQTVTSRNTKHVVIVIDVSKTLSDNQLETGKELVRQTLNSLSNGDKVLMLSMAADIGTAATICPEAAAGRLITVTPEVKSLLFGYIEKLDRGEGIANHTLAIQTLLLSLSVGDSPVMVLYITSGVLVTHNDVEQVLKLLSSGNEALGGAISINTYALTDKFHKPNPHSEAFLEDLAKQNYAKYNITYSGSAIKVGEKHTLISAVAIHAVLQSLFSPTSLFHSPTLPTDTIMYSDLYRDIIDNNVVVSMSTVCKDDDTVIGVVGVDLLAKQLFDQVIHFADDNSEAFIINQQGLVVVHPLLPDMFASTSSKLAYLHITALEPHPGFQDILETILNTTEGVMELCSDLSNTTVSIPNNGFVYSWSRVRMTPYTVILRTHFSSNTEKSIKSVSGVDIDALVYHRLDLGQLPTAVTCLHFLQLASFSTSAVFLSPRAFENLYEHISKTETKNMVQNYMAYLRDSSSYITKPGLKNGVKNDVLALSKINGHWIRQWRNSAYKNYIIRRYISTWRGVYRMFPATLTNKLYEPPTTLWYTQASHLPGRVVLTRPRVDSGGAGLVITISYSIYEGKSAALHHDKDPVAAVVAADIPMSYFQRLLLTSLPSCSQANLRCFILDDRGYLLTHSRLSVSNIHKSKEQYHVTHMEPVIAHYLLGHEDLIVKNLCVNYTGPPSVQRYYQLNTNFSDAVTNRKSGDNCLSYQMSIIPGTNSFLVMVNETCDVIIQAFCPCSTLDRQCLNCHRMEQTECECPCECDIERDVCSLPRPTASDADGYDPVKVCDVHSESDILQPLPDDISEKVAQCLQPQCDKFTSKYTCMGVMGCSWCSIDFDGRTPLSRGYCAVQQLCFGGILGARTPYNDQLSAYVPGRSLSNTLLKNTPVGPVTGAVLGFMVLMALTIYCYRHNRQRHPHVPSNSSQYETAGHNTDRDLYIYHELPAIPGPSHSAAAPLPAADQLNIAGMDDPAHISPYRINDNYRPPRPAVTTTTESSDHGYSTMTVQDDIDNQSSSCVESVASGRSRFISKSKTSLKLLCQPHPSRKGRSDDDRECSKLLPSIDCDRASSPTISQLPCSSTNATLNLSDTAVTAT